MWLDVVDLRDFYTTPLGRVARRVIQRRLRTLWPNLANYSVLGYGFATPYLNAFRGEAERVIAAMPASQGVLHWPAEGQGLTTLADETNLPLADLSVDRVLMIHAVECGEQLRPMMREIWRVLTDNGRLIIVVPNRRGIWARFERTPFGWGRPYTPGQLTRMLEDTLFTPITTTAALFMPPGRSRMLLSSANAWENLGERWAQPFGGVVMIEAVKEIYGATPEGAKAGRRAYAVQENP